MMEKKELLVEAKNIVTTFPFDKGTRTKAVDGVSFELRRGEIVGLVGESGSGKSVTSMSILQLILPPGKVSGEVHVEGIEGNALDYGPESEQARAIRGGKIGMIFQEPMTSLNPILTVGYQISENIMTHLKVDKAEAKRQAIAMMEKVGIANPEIRYNQYPLEFSGGMRQRIMIAMVLAAKPEVLIADEATTALAASSSRRPGRDHSGTDPGTDPAPGQGRGCVGHHRDPQPGPGGPVCRPHLCHVRRQHCGIRRQVHPV